MVNQTIFNGIMQAVSRGESLQQAMMSFFYAGYSKQEIEDAATEVQKIRNNQTNMQQVQGKIEQVKQNIVKKIPPIQPVVKNMAQSEIENKQEVSRYETPKKKGIPLWMILILSGVLFLGLIILWFFAFT